MDTATRVTRTSPPIPLDLQAFDASACGRCGGSTDKLGQCARRCDRERVVRHDDAPTGAE